MSRLSNGWFVFMFLEDGDALRILDRRWLIGKGCLVLSRWWLDFDPELFKVHKRHLWVLLPNLPLPFWSQEELCGIAKVLVEIDLVEDIPEDVELA